MKTFLSIGSGPGMALRPQKVRQRGFPNHPERQERDRS
jgi:hypothetical protein